MARKRTVSPSRYDVAGNVEAQYVDARKTVLVNKKGIRALRALQHLEEEALAKAYEQLLREVRTDTPVTCDLFRHIHATIFGDLYAWAGGWRTVRISKPGALWPPPDFLDQAMQEYEQKVLRLYPATALHNDEAFCYAAGMIQGEFLAIHPFREGNARTIKLLTDLLAAQTGRPLLVYDKRARGQRQYFAAAQAAMRKEFRPMTAIIRDALAAGRKASTESAGGAPSRPS